MDMFSKWRVTACLHKMTKSFLFAGRKCFFLLGGEREFLFSLGCKRGCAEVNFLESNEDESSCACKTAEREHLLNATADTKS